MRGENGDEMTATQHQRITETVFLFDDNYSLKNREAWLPLASGRKRHWCLVGANPSVDQQTHLYGINDIFFNMKDNTLTAIAEMTESQTLKNTQG